MVIQTSAEVEAHDQPQAKMTLEAFIAFALLPENADKDFEFINGEIRPMSPSRTSVSKFSTYLSRYVLNFCEAHNLPLETSGEAGAYIIGDATIAPDFAYKTTPMNDDYPDPVPPLLAAEVVSPTDSAADIRDKRAIYLAAGILYWEIYPQRQSIDVYAPGKPPHTLGVGDTLDGGDVLPGFSLPVSKLFVS